MRILLIEDSRRLRTYIGKALTRAGFAVDFAADGAEGQWFAESNEYDVIVLDIMLPQRDGLTVLKNLREQGNSAHVLLLTAKDTVDDRVTGLELGADDYLIKPFAMKELLARVKTLARRGYEQKTPVMRIGALRIDTAQRRAERSGAPLDLTAREFNLLEYLALRRGEVVSRVEIEAHIYDDRVEPMSNVVDSAVCQLRKKIDPPGGPSLIETRRGAGYLLSGNVS